MNNTMPIIITGLMTLFSCFNGPAFDSNALSCNVYSDIISMCQSCGGNVGCEKLK